MVSCLGSLVQSCCGEGGALQTDVTGLCGEHSQCSGHTGFAPLMAYVLSPSTLLWLQAALQEAGPELHALPRSKPLRFMFSGTPQRRRLGWACIFVPSPAQAAQGTRSLRSAFSSAAARLLPSPSQPRFPGAPTWCALCLFWRADLWLQPSQWMSTIQNLRKSLVRNWKPVCSLVGGAVSGAEFAPFPSPLPHASSGVLGSPQPASPSLELFSLSFVL